MLKVKLLGVLCVSMGLSACATAEMPSRARTDLFPAVASPALDVATTAADLTIASYDIVVPKSLLVSEADVFLPNADIVWHGDPVGDRHAQIAAIFDTAFQRGTADLTGSHPVTVRLEVTEFHALTPKTRATVGGNYAMHFVMTVVDTQSGAIVLGPVAIKADTPASGGRKALQEEADGITQKVVVVARLAEVLAEQMQRVQIPQADVATSRDAFSPYDLTLAQ